jgi:hypothetical protein
MYDNKIKIKEFITFSEDELRAFLKARNLSIRAAAELRLPEEVIDFDKSIFEMSTDGDYWGNCIVHLNLFFKSLDGATKEKIDGIEESCAEITNYILSEAEEGISFAFNDDDKVCVGDIIFCDMMYRYFHVLLNRKQNITTLITLDIGDFPEEFIRNYITETREAIIFRFGQ